MKQGNVFTFGDIMGLRRRIKNKIKSIFFPSKGDENTGNPPSNVMYETPSSPIQSKESGSIEEEVEEQVEESKQDTNSHTEKKEPKKEERDREDIVSKKEDSKKEDSKKEDLKKEKEEFESVGMSQSVDANTKNPDDSQGTWVVDIKDTSEDVATETSALQDLFNDEDIEQAVFIYNVSKLDMTHCPNCNEEVFGNWTYEEGKYLCSSCQSVLA